MIWIRAYRILRGLRNYHHLGEVANTPQYLDNIPLQNHEQICGYYENVPNARLQAIVITTHHLYLEGDDTWRAISYDEIQRIDSPAVEMKHKAEELLIHTKSGETIAIPIRGGDGSFRDLWEFLRFLRRSIEDISDG